MKKVDFNKLQAGDLVEVPRTQFAPMRRGWNGWLFSEAVVIRKGVGRKSKKNVVVVEMRTPAGKNSYGTIEATFYAENVFTTPAAKNARNILKKYGIEDAESFYKYVKNVLSKYMRVNFNRYLAEMERLGYSNNFEILDARDFGLPQARERVFTVSVLGKEKFIFDDLIKTPMQDINKLLLQDAPPVYDVTQPSVLEAIGQKGIRRATVIEDYAFTITARQDRTPAQVIDMGNGRYRYLTELECWRLQGYSDADFEAAAAVHKRNGRYTMPLYKQAGNSIPVPIFESIFRKILLGETEERQRGGE